MRSDILPSLPSRVAEAADFACARFLDVDAGSPPAPQFFERHVFPTYWSSLLLYMEGIIPQVQDEARLLLVHFVDVTDHFAGNVDQALF